MKYLNGSGLMGKSVLIVLAVLVTSWRVSGAETNSAPVPDLGAPAASNTTAEAEQQLRAYLRLQEQLHATLLAIEQARLEASQETRAHSENLAARLDLLERSLANQREERWQNLQSSLRTMLVLAGSLVGLGLLALA